MSHLWVPQKVVALLAIQSRVWEYLGSQFLSLLSDLIGHVDNIPTMQFFTGISRNTQFKSYKLSLTECVLEFQRNALWYFCFCFRLMLLIFGKSINLKWFYATFLPLQAVWYYSVFPPSSPFWHTLLCPGCGIVYVSSMGQLYHPPPGDRCLPQTLRWPRKTLWGTSMMWCKYLQNDKCAREFKLGDVGKVLDVDSCIFYVCERNWTERLNYTKLIKKCETRFEWECPGHGFSDRFTFWSVAIRVDVHFSIRLNSAATKLICSPEAPNSVVTPQGNCPRLNKTPSPCVRWHDDTKFMDS